MNNQENAVITVVGKDTIGILARASACAAEARTNVLEVSQNIVGEYFTMTMLVDISKITCSIKELEDAIRHQLPGFEIHVMHENIFNSMHRI